MRAAQWAVGHVSLDDPGGVAKLLRALREAGADDAARTLADRAAAQVGLDRLTDFAWLLRAMREAGADDAAGTLADRASLDNPGIAELLRAMREAGADDAAGTLADPGDDRGEGVTWMLVSLAEFGADNAVRRVADWAAPQASLDETRGVVGDVELRRAMREAGARLAARTPLRRRPGHPGQRRYPGGDCRAAAGDA